MTKASLHPNEKQRLAALAETHLLDSGSDQEFDDLTKLASIICESPISLISLVDEYRQWFKSKQGTELTETTRDVAFCAHAILQDQVFVVEDALNDERFANNPLVVENPKIRFYAGAPLYDLDSKQPLGTLCVIDTKKRHLRQEQIEALRLLSFQASRIIKLKKYSKMVTKLNENLSMSSVAIQNLQEGFVFQNEKGEIINFNESALKILELTSDQLSGKTSMDPDWQSIYPNGEPFPGENHPAMVALKTGKIVNGVIMGIKSKDSKTKWISINASPIFKMNESKPSSVVATFVDVTLQQLLQQQKIENARLVSIAELSSGIAHEINNPLTIINGAASFINKATTKTPIDVKVIHTQTEKIINNSSRIAKIISGLRNFSRDIDQESIESLNLANIVNEVMTLIAAKVRNKGIEVEIICPDDLYILARQTQIAQVLVNLIMNSYDAILNLEVKWIKVEAYELDNHTIKIEVSDSGKIIDEQTAQKMFLPFFTTKEVGKGTGLGLSVSLGLIKEMGGEIYLDKNKVNTTISINLKKSTEKKNSASK